MKSHRARYLIGVLSLAFNLNSLEAHPPPSARNLFLAGRDQWIMLLARSIRNTDFSNFGLRCSVLRPNRLGGRIESNPELEVGNDSVQLRVESNADSYLYVLQRDKDHWIMVSLEGDTEGSGRHISAPRSPRRVVVSGGWLAYEDEPESKQLFIVLSRMPIISLEKLAGGSFKVAGDRGDPVKRIPEVVVDDNLVNAIRGSVRMWDFHFEKLDDAVYVVSKKAQQVSRIVMDVALRRN